MATPAARLMQDQNLNIHSTGKADLSRPTKKGAVGGRRALNDISNSGMPSGLQPSTNIKPTNAVPFGKETGANKENSSKNQETGKASSRKALRDLTNTVKPSLQHQSTRSQDKKLSAIDRENVPSDIKGEGFLHDHQECVKAQRESISFEFFLETVGLNKGSSLVFEEPSALKPESPVKRMEIEEMPMTSSEDEVDDSWQAEFPGNNSSPMSVELVPVFDNYWKDEAFLDIKLIESPKLQKQ